MDRIYPLPTDAQPWTRVGLLGLALFGFYVLALDQGWLLSLVQGARAYCVKCGAREPGALYVRKDLLPAR